MSGTWLVKCPDCRPNDLLPNAPMLLRETCGECADHTAQRHTDMFPGHRVTVHPPAPRSESKDTQRLLRKTGLR